MSNFLFSHNVFFSNRKVYPPFVNIFDIISLFAAEFEEPKIGILGKGLMKGMWKTASGLERTLHGVLVKRFQESKDRWTGCLDITEIILKMVLNPIE